MRSQQRALTIDQAQVVSDAKEAAKSIPRGLDDIALADAVWEQWMAWQHRVRVTLPNGIYLFNITVLKEYLIAQGQQMTLIGGNDNGN